MEEKIEIGILLNLYGNMLTETQRNYMEMYYNQDLSLSEIAEIENITRQAVRTNLLKSKKKLYQYEKQLNFMQKEKNIRKVVEKMKNQDNKHYIETIYEYLDF